jgi:hypothetical protein
MERDDDDNEGEFLDDAESQQLRVNKSVTYMKFQLFKNRCQL